MLTQLNERSQQLTWIRAVLCFGSVAASRRNVFAIFDG